MRSFKISLVRFLIIVVALLMLGTSTFAQVSVTLPKVAGVAGATGTGAITVGDLTGKNVTAFQFTISYDKSIIYITGVNTDNTLVGDNAPTVNADTANGKLLVSWASATALTGSGKLLNLEFAFRKGGEAELNTGTTFLFNATAATVTPGTATVPQVLVQAGSIPARVGDIIKIPILVTAITDPQQVISYDFVATYSTSIIKINGVDLEGTLSEGGATSINIDSTAGIVRFAWARPDRITTAGGAILLYLTGTAVGVGTAIVDFTAFQFNQGSPLDGTEGATVTVTLQNFAPTLTLDPVGPDFTAPDGVQLKITLNGADQNTEDVASLAYSISDPATLPAGAVLTGNVFTWTPTVAQRSATPYSFTFMVKDQGLLSATKTVSVTVAANAAPTLTLDPVGPSFTINEGDLLSISLVGADANPADVASLVYSISDPATLPGNAKLTGKVFTWTPSGDEGRVSPYAFTFKVADQTSASATVTISVTVKNINRAPVFTTVPEYTICPITFPDPTVYEFTYVAADPDGDLVTYSLLSGPAGSSVDVYGKFTWGPVPEQKGQVFNVIIQASDGVLTSTTSNLIAASGTVDVAVLNGIPTEYNLFQNYPNPFNPTTSIQFAIPKESFVKLTVFNILGQEMKVLVNKNMSAGNYKINFDASRFNSGMYVYRIEAGDFVSVRKMLLVK